ncbi:MAG: sugar phosphate isomerase/epimerase [Sedimentisphaerales bacterium]|nr:sugar phosphate isomerase/epimerase [Sedimentisphaerales bacterium]
MKTGFDMLLWTTHVTEEYFPMIEKIKQIGYDGVEIPIFGGEVAHFEKLGKVIKDNGLDCASVTVIPDEQHNPISPDKKNRKGALEHLKWAIDCSAAMDSEVLCGPLYQPLGVFTGAGPTEEEKQRAAEVHRRAGDLAKKANLVLALEYLNRFEAYFLNTMADAVAYVKRVNHPNVGVHYDTFHANIEEKDPVGCISPNIDFIRHVHISENDRGTPGKGHIDWPGTFKALRSSGYDSWLVIEAFGRALPDLAAATKVWRDFFPDRDGVYTEGLQFIRDQWEAAG